MHDIVVRGGWVVDGSGSPPCQQDIAIDGRTISIVGSVPGTGRTEIDATGLLVAPGFVDVHTHYDGQATWDPELAPSSWHGVTTVVMGNCGVGFAPARPDRHDWLIKLMEGVEDIPGTALAEGITWGWETFPEYLDVLERLPRTVDVGCHVPHAAVRAYVMGERGARNEVATSGEIAEMSAIVEEGLRAGALGFSTSRTCFHKSMDGEVVPGTWADREELLGLGRALGRAGHGVFELISDLDTDQSEFDWMRAVSIETGRPVIFTLMQSPTKQMSWRQQIEATEEAVSAGATLKAGISQRGTGLLMNWRSSAHPFDCRPSWKQIAGRPWEEQLARLSDPAFKKQLLTEPNDPPVIDLGVLSTIVQSHWDMQYVLGEDLNYEPAPDDSIGSRASAEGMDPAEIAYDSMMADFGTGFIYLPILNYMDGNLDYVRELLDHPDTVLSLGDGGAHCGLICDAAAPTYLLTYWARDRRRTGTISLESAIKRQARDTALLYGLNDRGLLAPGYLADLNIIDFDALRLCKPYLAFDLPANGRRLLQKAQGYRYTIKSGQVTFRDGKATGVHPGGVVRGPQLPLG